MPHECTNCGRTFADGSKEMLSGCPNCGGKKFQFRPAGSDERSEEDERSADDRSGADDPSDAPPPTEAERPSPEADPSSPEADRSSTEAGPSAETETDPSAEADATSASDPDPAETTDPTPAGPDPGSASSSEGAAPVSDTTPADAEDGDPTDAAPPDAETGGVPDAVATPEDTAQASARSDVVSPDELRDAAEPAATAEDEPDIETLREELNEQFESIRILNPGQYELNLMELYDREEYIISLREDGRYVIEMPESWGARDDE